MGKCTVSSEIVFQEAAIIEAEMTGRLFWEGGGLAKGNTAVNCSSETFF